MRIGAYLLNNSEDLGLGLGLGLGIGLGIVRVRVWDAMPQMYNWLGVQNQRWLHSTGLLLVGYNIVCSGLCECNEHHPLQTCCNLLISW